MTERLRLERDSRRELNWKRWGPYLAERQWGTVREDYSADGDAWRHFPHDHARSRAYRWGEDGLLGLADRQCRLCFAVALWNRRDPFLKERLFGLAGPDGNHGEDVKEAYFYVDATPTHSYGKALYRYPQAEFPYARLVEESRRRTRHDPEFELADCGVFDEGRFFDVTAEFAKRSPNDVLIRLTVRNHAAEAAELELLPILWFRNTWSWGCRYEGCKVRPELRRIHATAVSADHETLGRFRFDVDPDHDPRTAFTENVTNTRRLYGDTAAVGPFKDAFHDWVVDGRRDAVRDDRGTKFAARYALRLDPGASVSLRMRLSHVDEAPAHPFDGFDDDVSRRVGEADAFYRDVIPDGIGGDDRTIARQAYAGLLWSKQFYHYIVPAWLDGDEDQPPPAEERKRGRNHDWPHLYCRDVISMPDTWEYPWFAAWDLAFHTIPFAKIDPAFAKRQLMLFLREWYMHPNGQIPAYEWALDDVNPPVHAWAAWRVYKMTGRPGERDRGFLASVFQKLLINFTWWVNRKDLHGKHIFSGGFLGLDNIGVFDRSRPLPTGGHLEQADATAWMAFSCTTMLAIALELASSGDVASEDMASKFLEHFVAIADAMNNLGGSGLWDEEDGFYYDRLNIDGNSVPLRVRSLVGVIPLFAVEVLDERTLGRLPGGFRKRLDWFLENRRDLAEQIAYFPSSDEKRLLAIPSRERLERVLRYLLDEDEFLSDHGIRSLSRAHEQQPFVLRADGVEHRIGYEPAESRSDMFGGNSNWRGPVWLPLNFLLVEALERYHYFYGDDFRVECPTGSGRLMNLLEVSREIAGRLCRLFRPDARGRRPIHGDDERFVNDPRWNDLLLFHEYFDGDTGRGLGAEHQTGWTALIVRLMEKC